MPASRSSDHVAVPAARPPSRLAITSLKKFIFGSAPRPVACGRGIICGGGSVLPELNFTLGPIEISPHTWPDICKEYREIIEAVCRRALDLQAPGLIVEFEALPPMTEHPEWALDITRILSETLRTCFDLHRLPSALRLTPNDNRDHIRPALLRSGPYWDSMQQLFHSAASAGADLLAIESTGGKEISDAALVSGDLRGLVFALGVLAPRDMRFLWTEMIGACRGTDMLPSGDTACGVANTAMVLAEQKLIPRVFAAVARVASAPRSLIPYELGAVGPSKDCAYEGPYLKALAGVPISMEGRTAACAHLSPVGNIAQAVCDCWSNESVQNIRLLSAPAPIVSLEQLIYDCRLMNTALAHGPDEAIRLRNWLTESDAARDPQAWVLRPDVVLRLAAEIAQESDPYRRTRRAVLATLSELSAVHAEGILKLEPREIKWLDNLARQAATLPESETEFISEMIPLLEAGTFLPKEYGLDLS